jgi:hypothetical protein
MDNFQAAYYLVKLLCRNFSKDGAQWNFLTWETKCEEACFHWAHNDFIAPCIFNQPLPLTQFSQLRKIKTTALEQVYRGKYILTRPHQKLAKKPWSSDLQTCYQSVRKMKTTTDVFSFLPTPIRHLIDMVMYYNLTINSYVPRKFWSVESKTTIWCHSISRMVKVGAKRFSVRARRFIRFQWHFDSNCNIYIMITWDDFLFRLRRTDVLEILCTWRSRGSSSSLQCATSSSLCRKGLHTSI